MTQLKSTQNADAVQKVIQTSPGLDRKSIMSKAGISYTAVHQATVRLENRGLIEVDRTKKPHIYFPKTKGSF